ncbi:7-cyano-7-deazaguanine synthase [hydrothermal vent metagenome]|uniref:7-cyano-7-deazaguanine synthase n=1 Tax=hydrothermal vent metagenome TaxID=652676 RepID=A0A3B0S406_9ZZZZ
MTKNRQAVVLLSGGLDSTTCVAIAQKQGYDVVALSFDYGQRHTQELAAAARVAKVMGLEKHVMAKIDLRVFGGSALTDNIEVPKGRSGTEMAEEIPVTYVPARNTIFLSFALAFAETQGASDIFIGVNALDFSGYPDCRPEYIAAYEKMANLATKSGVEGEGNIKIHTPLINMTKADIVRKGLSLGVDYGLTTSCYDPAPDGISCGRCDACHLRLKGFREAGVSDPVAYK